MPGQHLSVSDLDGAIRIHGKPSDILIESPASRPLGIDRVAKEDLGVVIRKLGIPLRLRVQPGTAGQSFDLDTGVRMTFEPSKSKNLKAMNLSGGLSTALHAQGRLPALDRLGSLGGDMGRVLALPVTFDLTQKFSGHVRGDGRPGPQGREPRRVLHVFGRPGDITIESPADAALGIERIAAEEAGVVVENLGVPMKLRLTPTGGGNAVDGTAGVTVGRVTRRAMGLRVEGISAQLSPQLKLPVARALGGGAFDIEKVDVGVELGLEALALRQTGQTIKIANKERGAPGTRTKIVRDSLRLTYDPATAAAADGNRYPLQIGHTVKLGNLTIRESRLDVKNLVVEQRIEIAGLLLSGLKLSQPVPASKPRYVHFTTRLVPNRDADADGTDEERRLALSVGGTPLDRPIAENELDIDIRASLPRLRYPPIDKEVFAELDRLDVRRLEFFNHSHGVHFAANGQVKNFVLNGTAMPTIDLSMFAGIDLPKTTNKTQAKHMVTLGSVETHDKLSVSMAGKLGLEARVRNLDAGSLELKGILVGDACHIWSEKHGQDPSLADGTQLFTVQNVHLKNLTMHAPMIQRLNLDYLAAMAADKNRAKAFYRDVTKLWPAARDIFAVAQSPAAPHDAELLEQPGQRDHRRRRRRQRGLVRQGRARAGEGQQPARRRPRGPEHGLRELGLRHGAPLHPDDGRRHRRRDGPAAQGPGPAGSRPADGDADRRHQPGRPEPAPRREEEVQRRHRSQGRRRPGLRLEEPRRGRRDQDLQALTATARRTLEVLRSRRPQPADPGPADALQARLVPQPLGQVRQPASSSTPTWTSRPNSTRSPACAGR